MQSGDVAVGSCPWRQQQEGRTPALGSLRAMGAAAGEVCLSPAPGAETGGGGAAGQHPAVLRPCLGDGKGRGTWGSAGELPATWGQADGDPGWLWPVGPPAWSPPGSSLGPRAFAHPQRGTLGSWRKPGVVGPPGPLGRAQLSPGTDSSRAGPAGWAEPVAQHRTSVQWSLHRGPNTETPWQSPPHGGGDCRVPSSPAPQPLQCPPETWSRVLEETQSQTQHAARWLRVWSGSCPRGVGPGRGLTPGPVSGKGCGTEAHILPRREPHPRPLGADPAAGKSARP